MIKHSKLVDGTKFPLTTQVEYGTNSVKTKIDGGDYINGHIDNEVEHFVYDEPLFIDSHQFTKVKIPKEHLNDVRNYMSGK